jgi:hypothetical protein
MPENQRKHRPEMKAKELLRWIATLTFGSLGIYGLVELLPFVAKWNGDILHLAVTVWMIFLLVVIPTMLAYLIFRRRYHGICSVLAMLGAIVVWGVLMDLPRRWHWHEFISRPMFDSPLLGLVSLGLSLLFLLGPFYGAAWFFRFCMRLAARYLPEAAHGTWPSPAYDEDDAQCDDQPPSGQGGSN